MPVHKNICVQEGLTTFPSTFSSTLLLKQPNHLYCNHFQTPLIYTLKSRDFLLHPTPTSAMGFNLLLTNQGGVHLQTGGNNSINHRKGFFM